MAEPLHALTPLGHREPQSRTIGSCRFVERFDLALASLAVRRDRGDDVARAAQAAGIPLPAPARWIGATPYAAFWVAPGMWFIEAPFATHEDIVAVLKPVFGEAASITEQTDGWIRLDVGAPDPVPLLERICNVDPQVATPGYATRTLIEHIGCYLIRRAETELTIYGPRSSARSLLHALETAAAALA